MKVILVYPASGVEMGNWLPLGIAYIAANLRKHGHAVSVIDREVLKRKHQNMDKVDEITRDILKKEKPELVGISATTPLMKDGYHIAEIAKKLVSGVKVVIGGNHVTSLPITTLRECPDIDIVVRGEGEFTFVDIADKKELKDILGISYKKGGKILSNPDRPPIEDLDVLPFPARDLFDLDFYLQTSPVVIRGVELSGTHLFTARGCPYSCAFCEGHKVFGKKVRYHSIDYVIKELDHLITNYKVEGVYFSEDMFAFKKQRAIDLCNAMIKKGLNKKLVWAAELRADVASLDLLKLMKKAGCIQVEYGFESGSQRMLNLMNKGAKVENSIEAAKLTHEAGLRVLASIIVGYPGDTKKDFQETVEFLKKVKPDFIGFNKYAPLPGSQIYDELKKKQLIEGNWDEVNVGINNTRKYNFTNMETEEFIKLFEDTMRNLVEPTNDIAYIKYNLIKHPSRIAKTFLKKYLTNPGAISKRAIKSATRMFAA